MTHPTAKVAYFEHWPHPLALDLFAALGHLELARLRLDDPAERTWSALAEANVYQCRSTRSELPGEYWAAEPLLQRCPQLLAVSTNGSGYDTVDVPACTTAGVLVVNQAGGNKQGVAEHALGMLLCLGKRIPEVDRAMRKVAHLKREAYMGNDAAGKTLGIIGLGNVGSHVAKLAGGVLGMTILAYDPYLSEAQCTERGARKVGFDELLEHADYVSVHCPRTAETEAMLDATAYQAMKRTAFFISTARGGIHDEDALADALEAGEIAGAGLDVWADEPPPLDHRLLGFDNVIVSPHTAGVTHESRSNTVRITVEQIDAIARGERPPRLLNPEVWPHYVERHERLRGRRPG